MNHRVMIAAIFAAGLIGIGIVNHVVRHLPVDTMTPLKVPEQHSLPIANNAPMAAPDAQPAVPVQASAEQDAQQPSAPHQAASAQQTPESITERRSLRQREFAMRLDLAREEVVDPNWSEPSERSLSEELTGLSGEKGFTLSGVDCRSSSCIATVRFVDFQHASDNYLSLVEHVYAVNCERMMTLTPPEHPSDPLDAEILFLRCDHREGQAE